MIIQLRALDGSIVEFEDSKIIGKGEMKDVYFSPDKSYVIAFYRSGKLDKEKLIDRLDTIVGLYRNSIFNNKGGDYWALPTAAASFSNTVPIIMISAGSRERRRRVNGLPPSATVCTWMPASGATGRAISSPV